MFIFDIFENHHNFEFFTDILLANQISLESWRSRILPQIKMEALSERKVLKCKRSPPNLLPSAPSTLFRSREIGLNLPYVRACGCCGAVCRAGHRAAWHEWPVDTVWSAKAPYRTKCVAGTWVRVASAMNHVPLCFILGESFTGSCLAFHAFGPRIREVNQDGCKLWSRQCRKQPFGQRASCQFGNYFDVKF